MTASPADAPPIPGLLFRGLRRPADDCAIAGLLNAGLAADGIPHRQSLAQVSNWLDNPSRFDPLQDILIAEVDGTPVGYAEGGWELDNDSGRNYSVWGQVHPDWRRRGLGTALLRWVEARQRDVAAALPSGVDERLESWAAESEPGRIALLERHGYRVVRYDFEMERPHLDEIPDLPLPDGIEFRAAREEDLRRHWEIEVEVFRDHWGAIDDSEASFERMRSDPRRQIGLWVVAWEGDEIVGQVLNRIDSANEEIGIKRGWISSVGVRRAWRRRGVARAMTAESLRRLRDAGMTSAGLGVDAENANGALGVYAAAGFSVVRTERVYRKPL